MKKRTTLNIEEEVLEDFRNMSSLSASQFCEDCMRTYVSIHKKKTISQDLKELEDSIRKSEFDKYLITSTYSKDFEKKQVIYEKLPDLWKDFTKKAEDLFFSIIDISEVDEFKKITGFNNRDIMELAEFLYESKEEDRDDYNLMLLEWEYTVITYNKEHDRIIKGDIL